MDADETTAADAVEQDAPKAAVEGEEQPTQFSDPLAEGETQSINAWSLADDDETEVTPFYERSWKIPAAVAAGALLLTAAAVGVWQFSRHGSPAPTSTYPAAPPSISPTAPPLPPAAPPARHVVGGRMVEHSLQLEGGPQDWKAVQEDLQQQGVTVAVNAVGAVTHLQFADQDTAPGNWVRWYAEHVPSPPFHSGPSQPIAFLAASEAGLPVPPPSNICYTNDGSPTPIEAFPGPYVNCGPTPGALAGH